MNSMSAEMKQLHSRRRIAFLEDLQTKRDKSRVSVYMGALKDFCGKQIYDIEGEDVLNFLIFKDVNCSGRTSVHHHSCPNLGTDTFEKCVDPVLCAKRHQAASMRTGIISKLRRGFEDVGRKGIYDPDTLQGDPTRSVFVSEYLAFIRKEQGMSGVLPQSANTLTKSKMDKFMENMGIDIMGRRGLVRLRMRQRRAIYAFCFTAIKRLAGAGHVIAPNTIRIPINDGLVFNCTWDKTLRMGVHCFGFLCVKGKEKWCAHCIIDEWVKLAKSFGIVFDRYLLFPRLNNNGTIILYKRWKAKDLTSSLERDLKSYNLYANETPHSFRHGGTVHSLKVGNSLKTTMYKAYMKNTKTACVYSKGLSVLYPDDFNWEQAGVDTSKLDEDELSFQMQSWKAFVDEKVPL